jgi:hypothetical protein
METDKLQTVAESMGISIVCEFVPYRDYTAEDWKANRMLQWNCRIMRQGYSASPNFDYFQGIGHLGISPFFARHLHTNRLSIDMEQRLRVTFATGRYADQRDCCMTRTALVPPTLADVLSCLLMDSIAIGYSFDQFCSEFGYDTDSRKAYDTYNACRDAATRLLQIMSLAELASLQVANNE